MEWRVSLLRSQCINHGGKQHAAKFSTQRDDKTVQFTYAAFLVLQMVKWLANAKSTTMLLIYGRCILYNHRTTALPIASEGSLLLSGAVPTTMHMHSAYQNINCTCACCRWWALFHHSRGGAARDFKLGPPGTRKAPPEFQNGRVPTVCLPRRSTHIACVTIDRRLRRW